MSEIKVGVSKTYNLLWMSPQFPARYEGQDSKFHQPIPDRTLDNMLGIATRNQTADVRLWVDPKRLTRPQTRWLEEVVAKSSGNMSVQDLRTIPDYDRNSFYNLPDNSPSWRLDKHSLIWRQVDAARILACLQGGSDQVFYSDADVTNLNTESDEIQKIMNKHGVLLSGGVDHDQMNGKDYSWAWYENGLFGFDRSKRDFFRLVYERTLSDVQGDRKNGYGTWIDLINSELKGKMGIDTKEIVFKGKYDGTVANHPHLTGK